MKCTFCGADMKGPTVCEICGKKPEDLREKLEVEYKDFKISEFLEIRAKRQGPFKGAARRVYEEPGRMNIPSTDPGPKQTFSRIIPIIVLLAFAAGVIYLLHYLSLL